MTDDVKFSIRQIDGAWRLMCAGGPKPVVAATEGIQYIFSGVAHQLLQSRSADGLGLVRRSAGHARARGLRMGCRSVCSLLLVVTHEQHYEGGHWLGTFAVYLESGRGLPVPATRR
jgi:hypothetical protein